jgi:hypothetical protein
MSYCVMTISRGLFFRLLAYAPEGLQREAKEEARRAIPALCFTEDDIRQKFAVEKRWNELSEEERCEAIQSLLDAGEYEHAGTVANDAITEAVVRYLDDIFIEKIERQAVGGFTW